ncbi:hypothetical protein [Planctomicrobium piriforme]|uniref:Uncharacterized protein n=1 Tax=Planctomicrobium piriforme TaxID=1576369 RepID=A0A1I3P244_9PLAN|nr:hypothetical protein [Planctomicrobium piriforme]SFJ15407.1 hypothetical protein SAMN05421753_11610 [Planctomicrobium piriforme]
MSARHKLNAAAFNGCLILAGLAGLFSQSWTIFWVGLILFTFAATLSGGIRPSRRR